MYYVDKYKISANSGASVGTRDLNFRFPFCFLTVFYTPNATRAIHPAACFAQSYNIGAYCSRSNVYQTRPVVEFFATVKIDFHMNLPKLTWPLSDDSREGGPCSLLYKLT